MSTVNVFGSGPGFSEGLDILQSVGAPNTTGDSYDLAGMYRDFTVQVVFSEGVPDEFSVVLQGSINGGVYGTISPVYTELDVDPETLTFVAKVPNEARVRGIRGHVSNFVATTQPEATLHLFVAVGPS